MTRMSTRTGCAVDLGFATSLWIGGGARRWYTADVNQANSSFLLSRRFSGYHRKKSSRSVLSTSVDVKRARQSSRSHHWSIILKRVGTIRLIPEALCCTIQVERRLRNVGGLSLNVAMESDRCSSRPRMHCKDAQSEACCQCQLPVPESLRRWELHGRWAARHTSRRFKTYQEHEGQHFREHFSNELNDVVFTNTNRSVVGLLRHRGRCQLQGPQN